MLCSYITVDELEIAFKEYNMGDDATIKEIMSEVDRDKVSRFLLLNMFNLSALLLL